MTFQSTIASIQNIRKQKQLELDLLELDRKWHIELKILAKERLGLMKELCKINRNQRELDHFKATLHGKALTKFADNAQGRLQHVKEEKKVHKYNFEPDPVEKMNLQFPLVHDDSEDFPDTEGGGNGHSHHSNHHHRRRTSGIQAGYTEGQDIGKVLTSMDLKKHRVQLMKTNYEQCTADRRNRRRPFWDKSIMGGKKHDSRDRNGFYRSEAFGGMRNGNGDGSSNSSPYSSALQYFNGSPSESVENGTNVWGEVENVEQFHNGTAQDGETEEAVIERSSPNPKQQEREEKTEGDARHQKRPDDDRRTRRVEEEDEDEEDRRGDRLPRLPKASSSKFPSLPSLTNPRHGPDGAPPQRPPRTVHPSLSKRRSASMDYLPMIKEPHQGHASRNNGKHAHSPTSPTLPTIKET